MTNEQTQQAAEPQVIRKTVYIVDDGDGNYFLYSFLIPEDKKYIAIPLISRDGGKTWDLDDSAKDAEIAELTADLDAAVKRAEDAEFSQAAMQEVVTTLIKAFSGIDVLIRNGDEDGIVQRFADAEKAMDAVVGRPSEAASAIRARLNEAEKAARAAEVSLEKLCIERDIAEEFADQLANAIAGGDEGEHSNQNNPWRTALELAKGPPLLARLATATDALNEIIGHGYTWPSTDPKSEDWRQGYSRGVSSVKSIAREALAALDAAKESK